MELPASTGTEPVEQAMPHDRLVPRIIIHQVRELLEAAHDLLQTVGMAVVPGLGEDLVLVRVVLQPDSLDGVLLEELSELSFLLVVAIPRLGVRGSPIALML